MRLWEIIKNIDEKKLTEGDKFKCTTPSIDLILEYDGSSLVYNTILGDTTTRDTVVCCSGELNSEYIKVPNIIFL